MIKIDRLHFLIVISFLLLAFDSLGLLKIFTNTTAGIILPVKNQVFTSYNTVKVFGKVLGNFSQIQNQILESKKLEKANEELSLKVQLLNSENTKLRQQLEAPLPASYQFLPSQVTSVSRYMEVWAGQKDKVKEGLVVLDGITLVGKVVSVASNRSLVMLVSDPEMKIPARTNRGTNGLIGGKEGGVVVFSKVLQKDPLFIDDLVVTAGSGDYPPNLLIGKITHINSDDVAPYKQAKIEPILDYSSLKLVFILTAT